MSNTKLLNLMDIRADPACQPRTALDPRVVNDYAEEMIEGAKFPPLTIFYDGETSWLADGFHRLAAAQLNTQEDIECDVRQGTQRDAILHACGANASHGLRRTTGDKQHAVKTLLEDDEWSKWNDSEIARRCGVTHPTVATMRTSLVKFTSDTRIYIDKYGRQTTMDTSNIGRTPKAPVQTSEPRWDTPTTIPTQFADDVFPAATPPQERVQTVPNDHTTIAASAFTNIERLIQAVANSVIEMTPTQKQSMRSLMEAHIQRCTAFVAGLHEQDA